MEPWFTRHWRNTAMFRSNLVLIVYFILSRHAVDAFGLRYYPLCKVQESNSYPISRKVILNRNDGIFTTTRLYNQDPYSQQEDDFALKKKIDLDSIDSVTMQAEEALQEAEEALKEAKYKQIAEEATAAGIGGVTIGLLAGAALDVYMATDGGDYIRDTLGIDVADIPTAVPPIVLGVAIGVSSYTLSSSTEEGNLGASIVRNTLGKATQSVGRSITESVSNAAQTAADSITSIPSKTQAFFQRKAQEAVEEVKAIPSKISTAAQERAEAIKEAAIEVVEKTVDDIKATPARVANKITTSAQDTAESIKEAAKEAVESAVDDIKATPGRIADSVQRSVDQTIEKIESKIEETVEDIKATPGKIVDSVQRSVDQTIETIESKLEETVEDVVEKVEKVTSLPGKKLDELLGGKEGRSVFIPRPPNVLPPLALSSETEESAAIKEATKRLQLAKPGATISLGLFRLGLTDDDPLRKFSSAISSAPKGVPTLVEWTQNPDGTISGIISGSSSFSNGETILTSPVMNDAIGGSVVVTATGSRYYLAKSKVSAAQKEDESSKLKVELSRAQARAASAEAKEAKERENERIRSMNEAKKKEAEERRALELAAAEARRKLAEETKKQAEAAAAALQRKNDERKAVEAKERQEAKEAVAKAKKIEEDRKAQKAAAEVASKAKQAVKKVERAKPGATISLGLFSLGTRSTDVVTPKILSSAPRGVPSLSNWRKNRDGSITGIISGSTLNKDGEKIITSPVTSDAIAGAVVVTVSGSKYYLEGTRITTQKATVSKPLPEQTSKKERDLAVSKPTGVVSVTKAGIETRKSANVDKGEDVVRAKEAAQRMTRAKPGATISLGLFGFTPKNPPSTKLDNAPRGIATISNWRQNRDGSITGFISGSSSFKEKEKVTTSPISSDAVGGTVVTTVSGSKYFLEDKVKAVEDKRRKQEEARREDTQKKELLSSFRTPETKIISSTSVPKKAPAGVPSLVKWRVNRDKSITGFISGSKSFSEGEQVTTSPIVSEEIKKGEVVKTGSGSKYFLV